MHVPLIQSKMKVSIEFNTHEIILQNVDIEIFISYVYILQAYILLFGKKSTFGFDFKIFGVNVID